MLEEHVEINGQIYKVGLNGWAFVQRHDRWVITRNVTPRQVKDALMAKKLAKRSDPRKKSDTRKRSDDYRKND